MGNLIRVKTALQPQIGQSTQILFKNPYHKFSDLDLLNFCRLTSWGTLIKKPEYLCDRGQFNLSHNLLFDMDNMNNLTLKLTSFDMILIVTCTCIKNGMLSQGHLPRIVLNGQSGSIWKKIRIKKKKRKKLIALSCTRDIRMSSNEIHKQKEKPRKPKSPRE